MEYQGFDPIIVLKVRNICCAAYQKKLKKELSKLDGVYSIDINPEKSLVSVRGKVDANLLLNIVGRTGKYAEIVCSYKNPTRNTHHTCWKTDNTSSSQHHRNSCCQENNGHKDEEEVHKCEDYVPPPVDERICRDYYCRTHRRRTLIRDSVPASEYPGFFGHYPHHARRPIHVSNQYGPWWFVEEPPPTGYGFHPGGSYSYSSLGYENGRGCIIM